MYYLTKIYWLNCEYWIILVSTTFYLQFSTLSKDFKTNSLNALYALFRDSFIIIQSKFPGVSPKKKKKKKQVFNIE